jgi:transcriptional regulator with XRE-family HTH domain
MAITATAARATAERAPAPPAGEFGALLRAWRERRRLSQLALALEAGVSQRHLSFVESGRAAPSRAMVLRLSEQLDVPLRERNRLLLAAGYAPVFGERPLTDPGDGRGALGGRAGARRPRALPRARRRPALDAGGREPRGRAAPGRRRAGAPGAAGQRAPTEPAPRGLAPRIVNYAEWRAHLLERVAQQVAASRDTELATLAAELRDYPSPLAPAPTLTAGDGGARGDAADGTGDGAGDGVGGGVFVPLRLATDGGVLALLSTTTVFGTPVDVTLAELALECFFPADAATAERLRGASTDSDAGPDRQSLVR